MTQQLVRYDEMCRAIDAAYEVDEVKPIRDKALAIEIYSKQAMNVENERRACEIRLRAERKCGQLLKQVEKAKGAPGNQHTGKVDRSRDGTGPKTLADRKITKKQSAKWQQLADVSEEQFEAALAGDNKPSTNGIIQSTKPTPAPIRFDPAAQWVHGFVEDFEAEGVLKDDPERVYGEMADNQREDLARLLPLVLDWLTKLKECGDV